MPVVRLARITRKSSPCKDKFDSLKSGAYFRDRKTDPDAEEKVNAATSKPATFRCQFAQSLPQCASLRPCRIVTDHLRLKPTTPEWLDSLDKYGQKQTEATVNRDMVPVRAALGQTLKPGEPNTYAAWQEVLQPFKGADRRRELYLDRDERKKLLDATGNAAHPFIKALCLLPLASKSGRACLPESS